MKIKKFLTENDINNNQYNLTEIHTIPNNPNIKSHNYNKEKISRKIKKFNTANTSDENGKKNFNLKNNHSKNNEYNFSLILKILDEEVKKSLEYKKEINSLKTKLNSKDKEIKILSSKINSLMNNLTKLKKADIIQNKNNQKFYLNFIDIINNFKQNQKMINISFPDYSLKDKQITRNKNMINTIYLLIKTIIDLCNNTSSNISKFNSLKNKINLFNESLTENKKKNKNEINTLKTQNNQLKKILDQNIFFLKELREENYILKNRNLNLEKNINIISRSGEKMRKKFFFPIKIKYNNSYLNRTDENININNISINTNKTNKTTTDILIEEFQDKENRIKYLHKIAHDIYNTENKAKK